MKNITLFLLLTIFCFWNVQAQNPPPVIGDWSKIYGDTLANKPTAVKAIGDGLFVAGTVSIGGDLYPTMAKFDITNGLLIWETQLDYPGKINDFENGENGNIIAVGHTTQPGVFGNQDNTSFIIKLDNSGNIAAQKVYDLIGRETFSRILRHKAPKNANFPYYILGAKNPAIGVIFYDVGVLINMDANLTINWFNDYDNNIEMELKRGLVDLSSGDLLLLGNGNISAPNDGILLKVDGQFGFIQAANYYPHGLDLYDGVEISNGNIVLCGTQFLPNLDATLFVVDGTQLMPVGNGIVFPDIANFRNVWIDQGGDFLTIGEQNDNTPNLHVVHRVELDNTGNLNVINRKYIEDGEQEFSEPNIFTSPQYNTVFYADGRRYNSNGFGDYDIMVGAFTDADNCLIEISDSSLAYSYTAGTFNPSSIFYAEPAFTTPLSTLSLTYDCNPFCETYCPLIIIVNDVPILDGIYQADQTVESAGTVPSTGNVDFKAGQNIRLNSGFKVTTGGQFSAYIQPCGCDVPSPDNLTLTKEPNDYVTLTWDEIPGVYYYIEYDVNNSNNPSKISATSPHTLQLTQQVYHQFTIFSNCDASLTNGNIGRTVSYTLSAECDGCSPPSNLNTTLQGDSLLLLNWDPSENGNFYVIELLDEDGNPLIDENGEPIIIEVDGTNTTIDITGLPDAFEVVLSVDCGPSLFAKRMSSKCHSIKGLVIVVGDVTKHNDYCNNKDLLDGYYTICCEHFSGATPSHFIEIHCP